MPWSGEDLEFHLTERDALPVSDRLHGELRATCCLLAEGDDSAGRFGQLEMAREKVCMKVRFQNALNGQPGRGCIGEIAIDVSLRIDNNSTSR